MKKTAILLIIISIFYIFISKPLAKAITIPKDAIRVRILPNSNSKYDQAMKKTVKNKLQKTMFELLKQAKNSDEAKKIIKENLNIIDEDVKKTLNDKNYNEGYKINYGYNYFPEKEYKGVKYEEGYYESLLVTLGKGEGDNWWCVLFPPLCLIEGEETEKTEYKSIVQEILNKYLS